MRVTFITRSYLRAGGATDELTRDLAASLALAGHDVTVLCSSAAGNLKLRPLRLTEDGVSVHRLWTPGWGASGAFGKLIDNLAFYPLIIIAALARSLGDDRQIILDLPFPLGWLSWFTRAISLGRCRTICWLLDLMPDKESVHAQGLKRAAWRVLAALNNAGFRAADANVVLGRCMADHARRVGVDPNTLHTIGTWSRSEEVVPIELADSVVRRQQGVTDRFVVLYAGHAGAWHHFDAMRSAAMELRADSRIIFAFQASGPHADALRLFAAEHQLTNIQFWPRFRREDAGQNTAAANVHLITQNPEFTGTCVPCKLYGVMAASRPVIYVGDLACQTAIDIRQANCGFTLNVSDARGLIDAILTLAADAAAARKMGESGHRTFLQLHDRRVRCGQWEALLHTVGDASDSFAAHVGVDQSLSGTRTP